MTLKMRWESTGTKHLISCLDRNSILRLQREKHSHVSKGRTIIFLTGEEGHHVWDLQTSFFPKKMRFRQYFSRHL